MDLLRSFKENIRQQNLFSPKDKLLLAVSGGVDSVVLCELCKQAEYDFMIAQEYSWQRLQTNKYGLPKCAGENVTIS